MSKVIDAEDSRVTVVAAHRVKPGKEKAFEQIMSGMLEAAMTFEGHLGANVLRPTAPDELQYRIIFKFDRMSNLHRWETSEVRHEWLARLADLTQDGDKSKLQILTSLETWFTLPAQQGGAPPPIVGDYGEGAAEGGQIHVIGGRFRTLALVASFVFSAATAPPSSAADRLLIATEQAPVQNARARSSGDAPSEGSLIVLDIGSDPARPRLAARVPLPAPPSDAPKAIAVDPSGRIALIAGVNRSATSSADGNRGKPEGRIFVVDLESSPPALVQTLVVGRGPSGLSISPRGDLALVAERADKSIGVLTINGKRVRYLGSTPLDGEPVDVAITPDGRRAVAALFSAHAAAILEIDRTTLRVAPKRIPSSLHPFKVAIAPDGRQALVSNLGAPLPGSDGHADSISAIDMTATPPRVFDFVEGGDAPAGLAISPRGNLAIAAALNGCEAPPGSDLYHAKSQGWVLEIKADGPGFQSNIDLGPCSQAVGFNPSGDYFYAASMLDRSLTVFHVDGIKVSDTGTRIALDDQPVSLAVSVQ